MNAPAKLLVIGLDAAERSLVDAWCASGDLPVLAGLRRRGASGAIETLPGLGDDAVWASFATGVPPGEHGRYFWQKLEPSSYRTPKFRDRDLAREPFWTLLSRAGRRVAILDVPKCPLTPGLNGVQLADWLVHGRDRETCSWPPELAADVLRRFGDDPTDRPEAGFHCAVAGIAEREAAAFLSALLGCVEKKERLATEVLVQGGWDLFLVVFKEAHCAGHQCWHAPGREPVKRVYRALDAAIGRLLEQAGPAAHVIVFSDLGMAANYTGEHLLDAVLKRLEAARGVQSTGPGRELLARLPGGLGQRFHPRAGRLAYQVEHNEISGAVRINLKGREPAGRVAPGREYEELCAWLTRELQALVNADTGQPAVDTVLRRSEVYPGEHSERLPDLFVVWRRDAPIHAVASSAIGEIRKGDPALRTGNHTAGGFYASAGPGIAAGGEEPASLLDLAPTIARMLGVELPEAEGRPIAALRGAQYTG